MSGPPVRARAHVIRKGDSLAELADFLANQLGRPVADVTGLTGRYDYEIDFMMEPGGRASGPSALETEPEFGVSLVDAVRDQLA